MFEQQMKVKHNMFPLSDTSITGMLRIKLVYYHFLNIVLRHSSFYDIYLAYIFPTFPVTQNFLRNMVNHRSSVFKHWLFHNS